MGLFLTWKAGTVAAMQLALTCGVPHLRQQARASARHGRDQ